MFVKLPMAAIVVAAAIALAAPAARAQSNAALAAQVAKLRREVDDLAQKRRDQRRATASELDALRRERADLERRVRLERVRARALEQVGAKRRELAKKIEAEMSKWLAPVRASLALVRRHVETTIPFKRAARLAKVQRIASDLATSHPDPASVVMRVWRFIEEEAALARDVTLSQQVVTLDGKRALVDVARVGMALLFVRAPGGTLGWARKRGTKWTFERIREPAGVAAVKRFFALLERNQPYGRATLLLPGLRAGSAGGGHGK